MSDTTRHERIRRELDCRYCGKTWTEYFYPARPRRPYTVCAYCAATVAHEEAKAHKQRVLARIRVTLH